MNTVKMIGRLTDEPKLKHIGTKKRAVCEMRVAVDNGRYPTTFINVSVFDAPAYECSEHLSKGDRAKIDGELRYRERTAAGVRRFEPHSIVGRVERLGAEKAKQPNAQPAGATPPLSAAA